MNKERLLLMAGNIGAGKTSLAERLGERLGWHTAFEAVADNPYLPDFYADMRAWAFHLQISKSSSWDTAPSNTWKWLPCPTRPS